MVIFVAEAACLRRLPHGNVQTGLLAKDVVYSTVVRHPLACVVFFRKADGGMFILVLVVRGGWGNLQLFELSLQPAVSSVLGWHVLVPLPPSPHVCRVRVA